MTDEPKKVDLTELRTRNAPLARVIEVIQQSNTWRDVDQDIAEDMSIAMKARDDSSPIAQAFDEYEQTVLTGDAPLTRKELAARIKREISGGE